jgi:iron complex transport system ATP-binding protein
MNTIEKPTLSLTSVSFDYGTGPLLQKLSLSLRPGRICAVLGPNGAGKSTILRLMAGLLRPLEGAVTLDDKPLETWTPRELARRVAWVAQEPSITGAITVRAFVALGRAPYTPWHGGLSREDLAWTDRAIAWAKITHFAERDVATLSGGERRRVQLARAYAQATKVILFDEPTAFLDPKQQWFVCESIVALVRERAVAAAIVLHDPAAALRYCDDAILLTAERTVSVGTVDEVLTDEALSRAFSLQTRVGRDALTGLPYLVTVGENVAEKAQSEPPA